MTCLICNRDFDTKDGLSVHIKRKHKISQETYYNMFYQAEPNKCPVCGKDTKFINIYYGYAEYCSQYCVRHSESVQNKRKQTMIDKYDSDNIYNSEYGKNKIKETLLKKYNVEHISYNKECMQKAKETQLNHIKEFCDLGYTTVGDLIDLYDTGWYQAGIANIVKYNGYSFVSNDQIPLIENYYYNRGSKMQIELVDFIKSVYNAVVCVNVKTIINSYELDIYLPNLKLAIEYNGIYWHSKLDKNYHLQKSIMCRNKGIRLIHIYEFEDIDVQKKLLKDLLLGKDNYPKLDFNKNNLIDVIPEPEIIYDNKYVIYGAGKLLL